MTESSKWKCASSEQGGLELARETGQEREHVDAERGRKQPATSDVLMR